MRGLSFNIFAMVFFLIFQTQGQAAGATSNNDLSGSDRYDIEKKIRNSYVDGDYATTVKLLETQAVWARNQLHLKERGDAVHWFKNQLFLAYLHGWKLHQPDQALAIYQGLLDLRSSSAQMNMYPPVAYLYLGEIYETRKDFDKALDCYRNGLDAFQQYREKQGDEFSRMISDELMNIAKYRIDGVQLKSGRAYQPLLGKIRSASNPGKLFALQMLFFVLAPAAHEDLAIAGKTDLPALIRQSTPCFASEVTNAFLILNASSSSIDESAEQALNIYLSQYPDGYFAFILGAAFYENYRQNAMVKKEKALLRQLQNAAANRNIELVLGPQATDKRFASPEKTWKTFQQAMQEGDSETAANCFASNASGQMRQMFSAMGPKAMKEEGASLGAGKMISAKAQWAQMSVTKTQDGVETSFDVVFHNIDGEWKMEEF